MNTILNPAYVHAEEPWLPIEFTVSGSGGNLSLQYATQRSGTNYLVERFSSENDMFNNINPVVKRNSTQTSVISDLGLAPGLYVYRLTCSNADASIGQATVQRLVV